MKYGYNPYMYAPEAIQPWVVKPKVGLVGWLGRIIIDCAIVILVLHCIGIAQLNHNPAQQHVSTKITPEALQVRRSALAAPPKVANSSGIASNRARIRQLQHQKKSVTSPVNQASETTHDLLSLENTKRIQHYVQDYSQEIAAISWSDWRATGRYYVGLLKDFFFEK